MQFLEMTTGSDALDYALAGGVLVCSVAGFALVWNYKNRAPPSDPMAEKAYRRILIPWEKSRAVIGPNGVITKAIEEVYSVQIRDPPSTKKGSTSKSTKDLLVPKQIGGNRPDVVDAAIKMHYMMANYRVVDLELKIPSNLVSRLIGVGGQHIRPIQQEFSVKVRTEPGSVEGTHRVIVTGALVNVDGAVHRLKDKIEDLKRAFQRTRLGDEPQEAADEDQPDGILEDELSPSDDQEGDSVDPKESSVNQ